MEFPVIEDFTSSEIRVANLRFNIGRDVRLREGEVTEYSDFAEKSGIFLLFSAIKDFYDYVLGVEVGMDTNARKNRSGDAMETVLKPLIEGISGELMSRFFSQTTFGRVGEQFGRDTAPLQNRRADFILSKGGRYVNVEVNYFSGGGSKPEEIVDSYINRKEDLEGLGWSFIWITDGDCWRIAENQLRKAFQRMEYVLNIQFVHKGMLREALNKLLS